MVAGQGNKHIYYGDMLCCYSSWLSATICYKNISSASLFLGKRIWMMMTNFTTWTTKKLKRFKTLSSLLQKPHNLFTRELTVMSLIFWSSWQSHIKLKKWWLMIIVTWFSTSRSWCCWELPQIELIKQKGDFYYLNNERKVIVSAFRVVANFSPSEILVKKRRDKEQVPNNSQYEPKILLDS